MNLSGETCLVTGGGRGLGRHIATELAQREVRVLVGVRDPEGWDPIDTGSALEVRPVRMDLSSREEIDRCCDDLGEDLRRIAVLVNNAGQFVGGQLEEQDTGEVYDLIQVNLAGPIHLTQRVLPHMLNRGRGKVVNNASIVARAPFPGATSYASTKTGLHGFSESLRRELDETEISVLELVTPGLDTDMMDEVQAYYGPHVSDTSGWGHVEPADWAKKVVEAIESGEDVLNPGGAEGIARLAPKALVDAAAGLVFSRR
ncbi:MAG: SDR family NAD(P)-dependent oxidoreductase [Thermoleophilaceae bacterium]|nr:SDR family NAD(P)-dependent oxidoreductase [Thermoleophilaceae bacterium]